MLLLEHPPVFTCGKRTDAHERPVDPGGAAVIDVDRGGKITFHGPGPAGRLPDRAAARPRQGRRLRPPHRGGDDRAPAPTSASTTARVPGRSGVWLRADDRGPERKIGAIGIRVSRGVTMHGFALNCDVDLGWYDRFVPCGIADAGVTCLSRELGRDVAGRRGAPRRRAAPARLLAWAPYDATPDYEPRPEPGRGPPSSQPGDAGPLIRAPSPRTDGARLLGLGTPTPGPAPGRRRSRRQRPGSAASGRRRRATW